MAEKTVQYRAKCADGMLVKITKENGLHRAFNSDGDLVGLPFVELGELLKNIGAELTGSKIPPPPAEIEDKVNSTRRDEIAKEKEDRLGRGPVITPRPSHKQPEKKGKKK